VPMHGDLLPHQTGITKALHDLTQQNHGVGNNHAKYYMSSVDINHINRMRHRLTTTGLKCQLEDLRGSTEMARSPSRLQEVGVWGHGHGSSALRIFGQVSTTSGTKKGSCGEAVASVSTKISIIAVAYVSTRITLCGNVHGLRKSRWIQIIFAAA
jgi:hypothetical protein